MKFTVDCEMEEKWIPAFLAMLKQMEKLGKLKDSRKVIFYSDGEFDYRPKFQFDESLPKPSEPKNIHCNGDTFFDVI